MEAKRDLPSTATFSLFARLEQQGRARIFSRLLDG
jgi:hypothetical protein